MGNSAEKQAMETLQRGCNWVPDNDRLACFHCEAPFSGFKTRRHHCRLCGEVFCSKPECWGSKALLPLRLFRQPLDKDPLASTSTPRAEGMALEEVALFSRPQPMCGVCCELLAKPGLRRMVLAAPEGDTLSLIRSAGSLIQALRAPLPPRFSDDNGFVVLNMEYVGQKDPSGNPLATKYYAVGRPFRLFVDGWRPFNKQTRVLFQAADVAMLDGAPSPVASPAEVQSPQLPLDADSGSYFSNRDAGEHSISPRNGVTPGTPQVSSMRRQRRKSRSDFVLEVAGAADDAPSTSSPAPQTVQLPNTWGLSCTSLLHVELTDTSLAALSNGGSCVSCVKLETFSEVILLTPLASKAESGGVELLAPHTMPCEQFLSVVKTIVGLGRLRGKVRMSTSKVPSGRLTRKSKS
jgi:hypothetical protein